MSLGKRFYYTLTVLFADITAFYCFFFFFSFSKNDTQIHYNIAALMLLAAVAAVINSLLARRELSLLLFVGINLGMSGLTVAAMYMLPHEISGFWFNLFAVIAFAYPAIRAAYLIRYPVTAAKMLVYCELSVFGTCIFFLIQFGDINAGWGVNALCVAAILLNLLALSSLRMAGAIRIHARFGSGLRHGLILLLTVIVMLAVALLLGLGLPATKEIVLTAVQAVKDAMVYLLQRLWRFLIFIFSLFPKTKSGPAEMEGLTLFNVSGLPEEAEAMLPTWVSIALVTLLSGIVIALVVFLLMKIKKMRMPGIESAVLRQKSTSPSLLTLLFNFFRKIIRKINWYYLLFCNYGNCAGIFIRIEQRGKWCGWPRTAGQTPREYLNCLADKLAEDDPARPVFTELACCIDSWCFSSAERNSERLGSEKVRLLKRSVKRRPAKRSPV